MIDLQTIANIGAGVVLGLVVYRILASLTYRLTRGRARREWFL